TINWYSSLTDTSSLTTGNTLTTAALTTSGSFYAAATENGCASARVPVYVNVNAIPATPASVNDSICSGSSRTIVVTSPGNSIAWFDDNSGITLLQNGNAYTTPVITANRTFYVRASSKGCYSGFAPYQLSVKTKPAVPVTQATQELCSGTQIKLSGSA